MRAQMTEAERKLWQHLSLRQAESYKFRRQLPLGRYIVDFVCLKARLIIEVDGGQHAERGNYDNARDVWLRSQGFTVLRFWNDQVLKNIDAVMAVILLRPYKTFHPHPYLPPSRGKVKRSAKGMHKAE
jgi:very-short-patch-repair endonuclease